MLSLCGNIVSADGVYVSVVKRIVGTLFVPHSFQLVAVEIIRQRQLVLAFVPLAKYRSVTLKCCEGGGDVGSDGIAFVGSSGDDVDDVFNIVTIAHAGIIDEADFQDTLRVER